MCPTPDNLFQTEIQSWQICSCCVICENLNCIIDLQWVIFWRQHLYFPTPLQEYWEVRFRSNTSAPCFADNVNFIRSTFEKFNVSFYSMHKATSGQKTTFRLWNNIRKSLALDTWDIRTSQKCFFIHVSTHSYKSKRSLSKRNRSLTFLESLSNHKSICKTQGSS